MLLVVEAVTESLVVVEQRLEVEVVQSWVIVVQQRELKPGRQEKAWRDSMLGLVVEAEEGVEIAALARMKPEVEVLKKEEEVGEPGELKEQILLAEEAAEVEELAWMEWKPAWKVSLK